MVEMSGFRVKGKGPEDMKHKYEMTVLEAMSDLAISSRNIPPAVIISGVPKASNNHTYMQKYCQEASQRRGLCIPICIRLTLCLR